MAHQAVAQMDVVGVPFQPIGKDRAKAEFALACAASSGTTWLIRAALRGDFGWAGLAAGVGACAFIALYAVGILAQVFAPSTWARRPVIEWADQPADCTLSPGDLGGGGAIVDAWISDSPGARGMVAIWTRDDRLIYEPPGSGRRVVGTEPPPPLRTFKTGGQTAHSSQPATHSPQGERA